MMYSLESASTIIGEMKLNPVIMVDISKSMQQVSASKEEQDEKIKELSNYHGYNIYAPFRSASVNRKTGQVVNPGILTSLLKVFKKNFEKIENAQVLVMGCSAEQITDGINKIVTSTIENSVNDIYQANVIDPLADDTMSYSDFYKGMGINLSTFIVDQQFGEDSDTISNIIVKFKTEVPMLQNTARPESFITSVMNLISSSNTDKVQYSIGLLLQTKDLNRQRVMEIFQFCMENFNMYVPIDMFELLATAKPEDRDLYDQYIQLVADFPFMQINSDGDIKEQIEKIYGNSNLLFLHKKNQQVEEEVSDK